MKSYLYSRAIVCCLLTIGASPIVNATTVTFDFTATVTTVNTSLLTSSSGLIGQTGTGSITYDLTPDYISSFPAAGASVYGFDVPDAEFVFNLAGMNFMAGEVPTTPLSAANADVAVDIRNDSASGDLQIYWAQGVGETLEGFNTRMTLVFLDNSKTVLSDSTLPVVAPDLALFDSAFSNLQIQIATAPSIHTSGLGLSIDSVSTSVVPVPAALWLFGSGLVGLIAFARRKASSL